MSHIVQGGLHGFVVADRAARAGAALDVAVLGATLGIAIFSVRVAAAIASGASHRDGLRRRVSDYAGAADPSTGALSPLFAVLPHATR